MPRRRASCHVRARAADDLRDVWDHTARRWSETQADRYVGDILRSFEALRTGSQQGRSLGDCFRLRVGRHFVFHDVKDGTIEIIRVLHQSMDVPRHL